MINSDVALANLIDLCDILKRHGVKHWIQNGTLLGFYRGDGFINHDTDTDLGVVFSTFTKEALFEILSNKFNIIRYFGYTHDCFELALNRNGVKTDLFFYYKTDGKYHHSVFSDFNNPEGLMRHDYVYEPFNIKLKNYYDYNFYVPEDELKYILTTYGETWKTPIKNWNYHESPLCVYQTGKRVNYSESKKLFQEWLSAGDESS